MGVFDRLFASRNMIPPPKSSPREIAVGAKDDMDVTITFNDRNITFGSGLSAYDYDSILRNKQKNIIRLFE